MKKGLLILSLLALVSVALQAQGFNYQTVLRGGGGVVLANESVVVKFDILKGSDTGIIVYSEEHAGASSNAYGVINLLVGGGTPSSGTFADIDWENGPFYLKVTLGSDVMGAARLNAVPYASFADKASVAMSAESANIATTATTATSAGSATTAGTADDLNIAGAAAADILYFDGSNWTRMAKGADDKVLKVKAGALSWEDDETGASALSIAGASAGDLLYYNGSDWTRLAKGSDDQVLTLASGNPAWADAATGGSTGPQLGESFSDGIIVATYPNGDVLVVKDDVIIDGGFNSVMDYSSALSSMPSGFRMPTHQEMGAIKANAIHLSTVWKMSATFWTSTAHATAAGNNYTYVVGTGLFNGGDTGLFGSASEAIAVKKVPYL